MNDNTINRAKECIIGEIKSLHCRFFFLIGLVISLMLAYTIRFVDDTPYYEKMEEISDLELSTESSLVEITNNGFDFLEGDGLKLVETPIYLGQGDVAEVTFKGVNNSEMPLQMSVDLYNDNYDLSGMEELLRLEPGETEFSTILPFYKTIHPEEGFLRFFLQENGNIEIRDIGVVVSELGVNDHPLIKWLSLIMSILTLVFALLLVLSCMFALYSSRVAEKAQVFKRERQAADKRKAFICEVLMYIVVTGIVTAILLILYREIDINVPLNTNYDAMGVLYYGKLIDEFGPALVGHRTGGACGFNMYDYPYSDFFSFTAVKFIGVFTDNPYLIINCFYFLCHYLAAIVSTASMRYLKLDRCAAVVLSVLFAFSPYIQAKYEHMWLVPYFMVPVACVIAMGVLKDEIGAIDSKEPKERKYCRNCFLCFLCAFEGIYYAAFTCMLLCISTIILFLNSKPKLLRYKLYPVGYIASVILGVTVNVIPNLLYWVINGINRNGDLEMRAGNAVEWYGLKLMYLITPVSFHRNPAMASFTERYQNDINSTYTREVPAVSLGIIGTIGLIVALLYLFKRNTEKSISFIIVGILLIACVGGVSSFLATMGLYHIRVYSRLCIYIMWLCLLQVGYMILQLWTKFRGGGNIYYPRAFL